MNPASALADLAEHLRTGAPIEPTTRTFLADAIEGYLAGDDDLDRALGLRNWGGVSPARAKVLADRDTLLRRLWKTSPDWCDLDPAVAARLMHLSAARYETTRWPRERDALSAPSAEPAATWWRVLRSPAPMPGAARLAQILRENSSGV